MPLADKGRREGEGEGAGGGSAFLPHAAAEGMWAGFQQEQFPRGEAAEWPPPAPRGWGSAGIAPGTAAHGALSLFGDGEAT